MWTKLTFWMQRKYIHPEVSLFDGFVLKSNTTLLSLVSICRSQWFSDIFKGKIFFLMSSYHNLLQQVCLYVRYWVLIAFERQLQLFGLCLFSGLTSNASTSSIMLHFHWDCVNAFVQVQEKECLSLCLHLWLCNVVKIRRINSWYCK